MTAAPSPIRRAFALAQALLLCAPLVALEHHHVADHDGGVRHIESDHGSHYLTPTDSDPRISGQAPVAPVFAVVDAPPTLPGLATVVAPEVHGSRSIRAARPPPASARPRAPPVLS